MSGKKKQSILIGITAGDVAGIGTEIIIKTLNKRSLLSNQKFIIYCRADVFEHAYRLFDGAFRYEIISSTDILENSNNQIAIIDPIGKNTPQVEFGKISANHSADAMKYIEKATRDAIAGYIDGIVTAPINKLGVHAAGYKEKGHTEFIAGIAGVYDYGMMFVGGGLRVVLLTIHLPLKDVPSLVNRNSVIRKIQLTHDSLKLWFGISNPRIAVCGLNPHGGEDGVLGDEDKKEILPAIEEVQKKGINAIGPLPADSIFNRARKGEFDAVLAMYHDQGIIPVKALSFGKGVNLTIGMPFIRTSPDHGTAYDIAGKGIADSGSMEEATKLAVELIMNRHNTELNHK